MGIFDRIGKNKVKKPADVRSVGRKESKIEDFTFISSVNTDSWFEVHSACLGKMTAIQKRCHEYIIDGAEWSADLRSGIIRFGTDEYPVQLIGTEGTATNSWQWGYKNINGLDDKLLMLANEVKEKGDKWSIKALSTPDIHMTDTFNGKSLSTVACGISDTPYCYYSTPSRSANVFLAFSNIPEDILEPFGLTEFIDIVVDCVQNHAIEHKIFLKSFLEWNKTLYEENSNGIAAHFKEGASILFEFERVDEFWRISQIKSA